MSQDKTPDPVLADFWNCQLAHTFLPALIGGTYWLEKIQRTFSLLVAKVKGIYGQPLKLDIWEDIGLNAEMIDKKLRVSFSSSDDGGQPAVKFYLSPLRQDFLTMQMHGPQTFLQVFQVHTIISFIHEIIHLSRGHAMMHPESKEKLIDVEAAVWAETCEDVMKCFFEDYGQELWFTDAAYYRAWQDCGRNPESPQWRNHIARVYKDVKVGEQQTGPGAQ